MSRKPDVLLSTENCRMNLINTILWWESTSTFFANKLSVNKYQRSATQERVRESEDGNLAIDMTTGSTNEWRDKSKSGSKHDCYLNIMIDVNWLRITVTNSELHIVLNNIIDEVMIHEVNISGQRACGWCKQAVWEWKCRKTRKSNWNTPTRDTWIGTHTQ